MNAHHTSDWFTVEGTAFPLGATWVAHEQAYNFAIFSKHATSATLLLFRADDVSQPVVQMPLNHLRNKSGPVWHCRVPKSEMKGARYYAYQFDGPDNDGAMETTGPDPDGSEDDEDDASVTGQEIDLEVTKSVSDETPDVVNFAETLEKVCVSTVENGSMTKDLAILIGSDQPWMTTNQSFVDSRAHHKQRCRRSMVGAPAGVLTHATSKFRECHQHNPVEQLLPFQVVDEGRHRFGHVAQK